MGIIRLLDEHLANQIAAGEVVERPASVLKELIENAVDAGAKTIDVTAEEGGLGLIRIADDGAGIQPDDLLTAFQRHATSKIVTGKDLFQIATLGFRGEALPSIAAVAKVRCVSAADGDGLGRVLEMEGGAVKKHEDAASPQGTDMSVRELFYNTPARLKYMRTIQTELSHLSDVVYRQALARPDIAFAFAHNGTTLLRTPGNGDLRQVVAAIYGTAAAKAMLPIQAEHPDYTLSGLTAMPVETRANRNGITILVNGRYVRSAAVVQPLLQAYHTLLPINRYPLSVLSLRMHPSLLDVNVHPAKLEVRFSKETELRAFVEDAVRRTLGERAYIPSGTAVRAPKQQVWTQEQIRFQVAPDSASALPSGADAPDIRPSEGPSGNPSAPTPGNAARPAGSAYANVPAGSRPAGGSGAGGSAFANVRSEAAAGAEPGAVLRESDDASAYAALAAEVEPLAPPRREPNVLPSPDFRPDADRGPAPGDVDGDASASRAEPPSQPMEDVQPSGHTRYATPDLPQPDARTQPSGQSQPSGMSQPYAPSQPSGNRGSSQSQPSAMSDRRSSAGAYDRPLPPGARVPGDVWETAFASPPVSAPKPAFPELYWIGQLHGTYLVAQNDTGLYLIDQHAAHERIHYELYYDKFGEPGAASQELLLPVTLSFAPDECAALRNRLQYFEQSGVYLEEFGGNTFIVRAVPHWLPKGEEADIVREMAEWILKERTVDLHKIREKAAILCSCKASIKANQYQTREASEALLRRLANCRQPYTCPHGRPIVVSFTTYELEKMFKRVMS
ncbi:DNA mismatch repair endonuclease MutL [Cohnella nanjingensis]|uniref:DNA mismatch repair protein MutL n=1 Tax=Cohnella nanjingensis TaxID=1387779 RepID=A0A7X0RKU1_9BACL|nr:DNA mismatch repair endonuclease MutL [Cohnella nanjingensis]MBB6669148.1 DNA mismatch repair endonuclease MutL [Cohnella nanjingensis]